MKNIPAFTYVLQLLWLPQEIWVARPAKESVTGGKVCMESMGIKTGFVCNELQALADETLQ